MFVACFFFGTELEKKNENDFNGMGHIIVWLIKTEKTQVYVFIYSFMFVKQSAMDRGERKKYWQPTHNCLCLCLASL